MMIVAA